MDRFEVMFDSEIENIRLRTRLETAKQIFKELEEQDFGGKTGSLRILTAEFNELKAKFLQEKDKK